MKAIHEHILNGFRKSAAKRDAGPRRIGAELKFPLVNPDGRAASYDKLTALWRFLTAEGWTPVTDTASGAVIGATRPGEQNDTAASCETGYCKLEFSMAHTGDLNRLATDVNRLRASLRAFCERENVRIIGHGIHPVTPPSEALLMKKKARTGVWDKVFGANRILPESDGDDVCLFTVNAASHVHVGVCEDEATAAINVLNGFSGAQIALTAHSSVWRGRVDTEYRCAAEKFWDWWIPEPGRTGVPERPFESLDAYIETVSSFRPVFVMRDGHPIILNDYQTFADYFAARPARGVAMDGRNVTLTPERADIDLHSTCYWFNARLSRYYTVENRISDQQPPSDLLCIAALTAGLVESLDEAHEAIRAYDWTALRQARETACRHGIATPLPEEVNGAIDLAQLAGVMLELAEKGLTKRGLGEETFLEPLHKRLENRICPGDEAARLFETSGAGALVDALQI